MDRWSGRLSSHRTCYWTRCGLDSKIEQWILRPCRTTSASTNLYSSAFPFDCRSLQWLGDSSGFRVVRFRWPRSNCYVLSTSFRRITFRTVRKRWDLGRGRCHRRCRHWRQKRNPHSRSGLRQERYRYLAHILHQRQ